MDKLKFVLLAVDNNDYQVEQVSSAQSAASKLGIEIEIIHTEHDSIQQSQIVLDLIQGPAGKRPNAIFFEPVGTALAQPARWHGHGLERHQRQCLRPQRHQRL